MDLDCCETGYAHRPVLLQEVLDNLKITTDGIYVDCTIGGAGHSYGIMRASAPGGILVGLDQDGDAIEAAGHRLREFGDRVKLVRANYIDLPGVLAGLGIKQADGILYDLGVSSYQLDNPDRGFSYLRDAPLDMRMNRDAKTSAADLVNSLTKEELARIISQYGEERFAARIASFIVRERMREPITNTGRLADIIKSAVPAKFRRVGPHPAKRTFQAIRIAVNNELEILKDALEKIPDCLKPGGRVCVITFHSLEDRIVKESFRRMAQKCSCPSDFPVCVCGCRPRMRIIKASGIVPTDREINENPRARSARLRVAEKLQP